MVDINQLVDVKINKINKKEYIKRGYITDQIEYGTIVKIPFYDIYKGSKLYIEAICDNPSCKKHYKISIGNYNAILKEDDKRNFCKKCSVIKKRDIFLKKYGVESTFLVPEIKEKIKETFLTKYGVEHISKSKDFQEKRFQSNIKKYGSKTPFGNKTIREKSKETLKEHYGVENPSQSDIIQNKIRESYFYKNSGKVSSQQIKMNEYLQGILNYPFKRYSLDIAFPDKKIDVEYNGGGHNLQVKFGNITENKFIQIENFRKKQLYKEGWKIITFISPKSKIFGREETINIFNSAINFLEKENKHWVEIYIDENKIITSQYTTSISDFLKNN